ncbi:hypothetical protein ACSQ7W_11850 [Bacillus halotolerans]|uniref:hypothetical protein n=1 Tax=Bacillus halotolerans TaxID=260554 RepID=UPI00403F45DD
MKPTITKEQADELEKYLRSGDCATQILEAACANVLGGKLAKLGLLTLAAALVNGYEVKKTPEEKVREYYEKTERTRDERQSAGDIEGKRFHGGALVGICTTLELLGIKIEGVNA